MISAVDSGPGERADRALPKSGTLAGLTLRCLKEGILTQRWRGCLPSERKLAEVLQVSRPVLRTALGKLAREGWIRTAPRRPAQITKRTALRPANRPLICLVSSTFGRYAASRTLYENLYRTAGERDIRVTELYSRHEGRAGEQALRREIGKLRGVNCWVPLGVTKSLQGYFMRKGYPVLIMGHRHTGIELPSIDLDNRATCRHAAGILLGRGHRHLVLLLPQISRAGDAAGIEGFREALAAHREKGVAGEVIETTHQAETICERLEGLLRRRSGPVGFIVLHPYVFLTLCLHLGRTGLSLPGDVSAISIYDHPCLKYIPCSVARYSDASLFEQACALIVRQVLRPPLPAEETLLIPNYIDGRTAGSESRL